MKQTSKIPERILWIICNKHISFFSNRVGSTDDITSGSGVLWTLENVSICKYHGIIGIKKNANIPHIELLGGDWGWCEVKYTPIMTDIKDYQMWKLQDNSIVSKFNHGTIGVDGNPSSILSVYTGDGDMVGAVSVDKTTSLNNVFKFTGL